MRAAAAPSAALSLLAMSLSGGVAVAAPKSANLQLAAGVRVGVVNLLDAEVTHFHASRHVQNSFLKTYSVNWPVNAILMEALRERLTQMGLVPVAAGATEALSRSREGCFLNAALAKGLPKGCGPLFAQLAAAEHVDAIIVLGPGLNDSAHAGDSRRRELPQYLRGWCFVSEEGDAAPTLLNLTELLLIGVSATGAQLGAREWGGERTQTWAGFKSPPDLKDIPEQQLSQLPPLFTAMLKEQASHLLGHLQVRH